MACFDQPARAHLEDLSELFDDIAPRLGDEDGEIADDDWDHLSDWFDDEAYSADWQVPLDLPSLPLLLDARHPYTWFDLGLEPPSYSQWRTATGR